MKLKCFSFLSLFFPIAVLAQSNAKPEPLKIGATCPDFMFTNLLNHPEDKFALSSHKGKWVILDFWSRGCKDCIPLLNEAEHLERKFDRQLAIIPVTVEKREAVEAYFAKTKALKGQKIFTVTGDTTLWYYFPHRGVPYEVWINPKGQVAAMTDGFMVTEEKIRKVIATGIADFPVRRDILDYDFKKPLLQAGEAPAKAWTSSSIAYSSMITRYQPGLLSMGPTPAQKIGNQIKMISTNLFVNDLYIQALALRRKPEILEHNPDYLLTFPSRTILEVKDSSYFFWPGRKPDNNFNLPMDSTAFCYESIMPLKDSNQISEYMLEDLNKFFGTFIGIEGLKEKRRVKCWALTRTLASIQPSKGGQPVFNLDDDLDVIQIQNCTLKNFLFYWISFHQHREPLPIIDESGYFGAIDFTLKANPNDLNAVSKALEPYGLQFQLVERELEMIVIKDKK